MTKPVKDLPASVRQRLQNHARAAGRPFQEVLEYYAMERFLYRLARSQHSARFVLKGALLFRTWGGAATRPTRDIDFLGRLENSVDVIVPIFREVCGQDVPPDGMVYDPKTVAGAVIKEDADYSGVRVTFLATLQNARVSMQADIGFGDIVTPGVVPIEYPTVLEFPPPKLSGYPKETVVAEKYEAMVKLGLLNTRMKDFYDLWVLSRRFDFSGPILAAAIAKTFANRKTELVPLPFALTPAFASDPGKQAQWKGFIKKAKLEGTPDDLGQVTGALGDFLLPVARALSAGEAFSLAWQAPGPWA